MYKSANDGQRGKTSPTVKRQKKDDYTLKTGAGAEGEKRSSHALHYLQGTAGNAAVSRMITQARDGAVPVQRKVPGPNAPDRHYTSDPTAHPEWPLFQKLLSEAEFSKDVIDNLWQLVLGGLREQESINPLSADPSLSLTERRRAREKNSWYHAAVEVLRENKGFATPKMALWSGGLDVCRYAQRKGFTPMEFTRAGKAFNELEYHSNWQLQGPMWNILSRFYVDQASGPVHIFLRSYNTDSVLMGREIPHLQQLQRINPNVELIWHPLYTTKDGQIKEISKERKLVDDASYSSRDLCVAALYDYLQYHHDENNSNAERSHREMHDDLKRNINSKKDA